MVENEMEQHTSSRNEIERERKRERKSKKERERKWGAREEKRTQQNITYNFI